MASAIAAGLSWKRILPAAGSVTICIAGAKPRAVTRTSTLPDPGGGSADHVPSAAVLTVRTASMRESVTTAPGTDAPVASTCMPSR